MRDRLTWVKLLIKPGSGIKSSSIGLHNALFPTREAFIIKKSIEYAINHLKTRVVVVMDHEGCGAVQAAMLDEAERRFESHYIQFLLDRIVPSVSKLPRIRDSKARMREAVIANVRTQVHQLKQNPVVLEAMQKKEIAVIRNGYQDPLPCGT